MYPLQAIRYLLQAFAFTAFVQHATATSCDVNGLPKPEAFGTSILSFTAIQVNNSTLSSPPTSFCNVSITYTHPGQNDHVNVWVWLPSRNRWNGRLQGVGGGGWVTGLVPEVTIAAVSQGYAAVTTDGGHSATAPVEEWGLISPGNVNQYNLQDFASVTLNEMTNMAKQITKAYYNTTNFNSYWKGCSTGGRQGLMLAQRYPTAYDGILAEAPASNWAELLPTLVWPQFAMRQKNYFPSQCEFNAITKAAVEACDALDGLQDGIIGALNRCSFDPTTIIGKSYSCDETNATSIISAGAVSIVKATWQGAQSVGGKRQWFGLQYQSAFWGLANTTCTSPTSYCTGVPFQVPYDWLRVFVYRNLSSDPLAVTPAQWDEAFHYSKNVYDSIIGTSDPNLSLFRKAGGKMITFHGLADPAISWYGVVDYYKRVLSLDSNAREYYRLYSAPGVEHCGGGKGAYPSDPLEPLVKWVESGQAPDVLQANRTADGQRYEQNLCQYPLVSMYKGGDPKAASSFVCQ